MRRIPVSNFRRLTAGAVILAMSVAMAVLASGPAHAQLQNSLTVDPAPTARSDSRTTMKADVDFCPGGSCQSTTPAAASITLTGLPAFGQEGLVDAPISVTMTTTPPQDGYTSTHFHAMSYCRDAQGVVTQGQAVGAGFFQSGSGYPPISQSATSFSVGCTPPNTQDRPYLGGFDHMIICAHLNGVWDCPTVFYGEPAPADQPFTSVKVLQLNICHSGYNNGLFGCFSGDKVITKAKSVIESVKPQVLSVNEACSGDVEPLRQAMGAAKTRFVAAQRSDKSPVKCKNGEDYGNVIMVVDALAGTTSASDPYSAQDRGNEKRVWACLPGGKLTACTTHLSADSGTTALAQCKELMSRAVEYARTAPTVVAGDMNLRYQGNPNVQDCNPSGFYRKGDGDVQHVFATTNLNFAESTKFNMKSNKFDIKGTTDHPGWLVTMTLG